jgi:hypothetical protein
VKLKYSESPFGRFSIRVTLTLMGCAVAKLVFEGGAPPAPLVLAELDDVLEVDVAEVEADVDADVDDEVALELAAAPCPELELPPPLPDAPVTVPPQAPAATSAATRLRVIQRRMSEPPRPRRPRTVAA